MATLPHTENPPVGLGMLALVLGTVALLLFFLPVLAIPIGVCGLFFGLLGLVLAGFGRGGSLRYILAGSAVCTVALVLDFALAYAPGGYPPSSGGVTEPTRQSVLDRPYVPPPATPHPGGL